MINSFLSLLYLVFVGTPQPKHSLHKKPTKEDFSRNLNCWIQRNFYIICLAFLLILFITFVIFCFWICGVSATESGNVYNHIGDVI